MTAFAELVAASNFTFLTGASHGDEMVAQARALGLAAIGLADRNSFAGAVRGHLAAKEAGIKFLVGVRLVTTCGFELVAYPRHRHAYGALARMLTDANFRSRKGTCELWPEQIVEASTDQVFILLPPDPPCANWQARAADFCARSRARHVLALTRRFDGRDGERLHQLSQCATDLGLDCIASNDALYHVPERKPLADVVACIREHVRIKQAGFLVAANAERHLKPPAEMARLFRGYEHAVANTVALADSINFSLEELVYQYPSEVVGDHETPAQTLRRLTAEGLERRWPDGAPEKIRAAIAHELTLIESLDFPAYFLTVHDIVRFARSQGILCQGRGSAANSAVCFAIGITEVDPTLIDLLFERFVSAERGEPPDIDVDFEHERREEVIQYVYEKYGRRRAAMTATVNCYRPRGAIREVGKVFGLSGDVISALSKTLWGWSTDDLTDNRIRTELGLDPDTPDIAMTLHYARELMGFPRHLSQHPGGFVMMQGRLDEIVPLHNAAMPDRTVLEWDKEDIDALGLMKVDVLGLGMLTCVARAFDLIERHYGRSLTMASIPQADTAVYDMICRADTVGVFQIESRAQMTMLPRLRPRTFYDLVIEVAIVRPGPIQGDMVHPYLRRRSGLEAVEYPSKALEEVLGKTLGVPLFQEQAMRIAIVAAGFTPAESDQLRRSMAAFRRSGSIHEMGEKLMKGMIAKGYEPDFAERCFKQLEGFGEYGFPESHAASFALIVYVSCWLKHYYPDVFAAAILNSQPMGFYAPAQLVRDARQHGVEVRPPDINHSDWDCTLEPAPSVRCADSSPALRGSKDAPILPRKAGEVSRTRSGTEGAGTEGAAARRGHFALRLGLRQIKGLREASAARLIAARNAGGPFTSVPDLARRSRLDRSTMDRLANADAFGSIALDRRQAGWTALAQAGKPLPLFEHADEYGHEAATALPQMSAGEEVAQDYAALRLSLKAHPMSFFRPELEESGHVRSEQLGEIRDGRWVTLAGLVLVRQRPGSASGVIFATLEDESGVANIIVWPKCFERHRKIVMRSKLMSVTGRLQKEGEVIHIIASRITDQSWRLAALADGEAFAEALAHADEIARPQDDPRLIGIYRRVMQGERLEDVLPKSRDFH
ncbi:error-prone DNA polymerase [Maricaulis salignorans]|uniref:error-prone DNA polymerase n=1 Tax=Maricaulis salignorans TaxID=144026 RepID=UPI003A92CA90